ncbi:carbohydrate ABC transporter permease, partial [Klebsiella pneumoniae]|nr:carbohydrate ABC transporter permease [Klebsiella pneumoniae]
VDFALWPRHPTGENYRFVFGKIPILKGFLNSLIVSLTVTSSVVAFGAVAGYALSRLRFRGREAIFNLALLTMMIPSQLTLIPLYTLMAKLG